jgi:hypothetical protein
LEIYQYTLLIHPPNQASNKTDVFRQDLRIRGVCSSIGAMVQKVKLGQLQSPFLIKLKSNLTNLFFLVLQKQRGPTVGAAPTPYRMRLSAHIVQIFNSFQHA